MALRHVTPMKLGALGCLVPLIFLGRPAGPARGASLAIVVALAVVGLGLLIVAGVMSRCPHCEKYLSYKTHWIGKYCPHCGKHITDGGADPPQQP